MDYSWFSPILKEKFEKCKADVVVWPKSKDEISQLVRLASKNRIPLTARGGGTGNWGQAVPMYGGVLMDVTKMNRQLRIDESQKKVIADAGVRLGEIMKAARRKGLALRIYPSTYVVSTVAGFLGAGSSGIGSIEYGDLWDGNVLSIDMITPEEGETHVDGARLNGVLHAAGTTGIIHQTELPLVNYEEYRGLIVSYSDMTKAVKLAERLALDNAVRKKLLTLIEAQIAKHYTSTMKSNDFDSENWNIILIYGARTEVSVRKVIHSHRDGVKGLSWIDPALAEKLTDFSFNHTTLWTTKSDRASTYVDWVSDPLQAAEHSRILKARYGDRMLLHLEFFKWYGKFQILWIPILYYENRDEIIEMWNFGKGLGQRKADVHSYYLEDRLDDFRITYIRNFKKRYDPQDILNPGKLRQIA